MLSQFSRFNGFTIIHPILMILLLQFIHLNLFGLSEKFQPCPLTNVIENRKLYVATCDTRSHWKEFQAMKVW